MTDSYFIDGFMKHSTTFHETHEIEIDDLSHHGP